MRCLMLCLMLALTGCGEPTIAVHGDSTALASRSGLAKAYNFAPSWDGYRWWVILGKDMGRRIFNDGLGGQSIATMRDKMVADDAHRSITTIIYDRKNTDEDPATYVEVLADGIATLNTNEFLIIPQVPRAGNDPDPEAELQEMAEIDATVAEKWPGNTFSQAERTDFINALAEANTRLDGLHRNERGQAFEAKFIGDWLQARGW